MDLNKINVRYAKALFSLALEKNITSEIQKDAELIAGICKSSNEFILLLESPVVKTSEKIRAFKGIFEGRINEYTLRFLLIITENNRELYIPGIFRNFQSLYRQSQGIKEAVFTSAYDIDPEILDEVKQILEKEYNATIKLHQKANEQLIGGFILRVDDQQYDASIASQLKSVKEKLLISEIDKKQ